MSYTEVAVADYNATPPTDDGSSAAANQITWAGIKTKLGDPINTAIASVNTNVSSACGSLDSSITTAEANITTISSSISSDSSVLGAPSATELFFVQTSAPTGWTKTTTHNDKAIRLVSGTVSTGGSTAFTSVFASRTITDAELPSHDHTVAVTDQAVTLSATTWTVSLNGSTSGRANGTAKNAFKSTSISTEALAATVSHSGTSGSAGSGSAMDFAVQYVDIILAAKS